MHGPPTWHHPLGHPTWPKKGKHFMPFANNERGCETQAELADAYGLLRAFWDTIENSMEGDHPVKERLEAWLSRFEATTALQSGE